jgi:hypothetical protein
MKLSGYDLLWVAGMLLLLPSPLAPDQERVTSLERAECSCLPGEALDTGSIR